jgi:serine phosphatase RsbU (regulator of sigma subunit)
MPEEESLTQLTQLTQLLEAVESAAPVDAVNAVTRDLGKRLRVRSASFLIADTSGRALVRLTRVPFDPDDPSDGESGQRAGLRVEGQESALTVPFDGGPLERVVRTQQRLVLRPEEQSDEAGTWAVLAPVTERGEVIGVLELRLPAEPSREQLEEIGALAHLLAFVVIANRRHTDLFEWGHRSRPLGLSAEIQQRLLPGSRTCEAGAFTLSGWLEPAADIAGDTFDYSLARDVLHVSLTDAMGHGVAAALTATLCVSALRGARRSAQTLEEQACAANLAVEEHGVQGRLDDFVTGLVGRLDLERGSLQLVNAGHVPPYLARGDDVTTVALPVNLPFGMFAETRYQAAVVQLQPGDRVVLVTDGMLERNASAIDLPRAIRASRSLHPREAAGALADSVLRATGQSLADDATVLCLDWYGGHGGDRSSARGADTDRASGGPR